MTKQQLLDKLQSSEELVKIAYVPVSEVINWVNELESGGITQEIIDDVVDAFQNEFSSEGIDMIEDYDLSMSYREVELDSVTFDDHKIKRIVENVLEDYLEKEEGA
jgi:uncharacterized protein YjgD (DUF1641 family)